MISTRLTYFFWNNNKMDQNSTDHHPIKAIAWNKIFRLKCEGGLSIGNLNAAYLVKQS